MPNKVILDIADRFEPSVREALINAFRAMRGRVPAAEVERQLLSRGLDGVMNLLQGLGEDLAPVADLLDDAVREGGRATVGLIPRAGLVNRRFAFDLLSPNTLDFIRQYRLNLIQQVSNETVEAVRQGLQADIIAGRNPRDTARNVRDTLGLTRRQETAVRNYRTALEGLDRRALRRELRDRRFDRTVLRSIETETPLRREQVDRMVQRYRERFLQFRAEGVARTESLRAVTVGNRASIRQMLATGAVDTQRVRRQWVFTRDFRTRNAHRSIPELNPGGIPLDGEYRTSLGPLRFPRDPNGTADNIIRCRCTEEYFMLEEAA